MNTVELIKVINNIPVKGEVCAKDLLPEKKPLDMKAYIVNTDISTDPGEFGWLSTSEEIKLSTSIHMEDHQKSNMFYHFLKETLQDGSITKNVYRVHGAKYVEFGVSTSFTSSTKD